ncbi:MAG: Gfo/Idh/MocA family oxidoreductase [Clostridia bacterium]|nr:Gfo/Idh/MocA family oxidoreductase [Clostridia bacterium]
MSVVRFGVIGTNTISDRFAEAVRQSQGATITAVLSRRQETADAYADRHGICGRFCDPAALFSRAPIDAVYVAAPHALHRAYVLAALSAGKHVLCEKIMALTAAEFDEMTCAATAAGRLLVEAMRPAFDPAYDEVRRLLPSLGRLRYARFEFCQYSSRYDRHKAGEYTRAFDPAYGNAAVMDIGVYPMHVAVMLLGDPADLTASVRFLPHGFECAGEAHLAYPDAVCDVLWSKVAGSVQPSIILGEDGALEIDKLSTPSTLWLTMRGQNKQKIDLTPPQNNMIYEIAAFCDAVGQGALTLPQMTVSRRTCALIDRVRTLCGVVFPPLPEA